MTHLKLRLILAASAAAVLAGCSSTGFPGFGDSSGGCRTVYVFTGGSVKPMNTCGELPRDTLSTKMALAEPQVEKLATPQSTPDGETQPEGEPEEELVVSPISDAAKATAPLDQSLARYPGANEMIENADMAAFMARVREDFAKKTNDGAWGFVVVDAIAADNPVMAQSVIDAMAGHRPPDWMSANHLRAWVYAFNGRAEDAKSEIMRMRNLLPAATLLGHRALLAEGMGDTDGALAIYDEAPDTFDPPKPEEASQPTYFARARAFQAQRLLALRQAELLRAVNRDQDAVALLTRLLAASPDDPYARDRLEKAKAGKDRQKPRTLKQAMALAIGDEADMVEEQEAIMAAISGRGGKLPFNYLLSSLRQSALLLDPDNGDIRVSEVNRLYTQGQFEATLRLAQIGHPGRDQESALLSTAGLAALQLGSAETLEAMTQRSLKIDPSPAAKIQAASALTSANKTQQALTLIAEAMQQGKLDANQRVAAHMTAGQAHLQAGDVAGAVASARAAQAIQDDESTQQFLASMLVEGPQRSEGLEIMRHMMADQPDNTGLMNNFGYSLIDGHASPEELDEGFRLLKQAIRMTPDEPNLLDSIGWAYYQYGDFREANRFIEMALEAYAPFGHWELSDHMGDVQWRLGDQEAARKFWKDALAAYPPAINGQRIEDKLKNGLTTPAPVRRDTPEVPRIHEDSGTTEI